MSPKNFIEIIKDVAVQLDPEARSSIVVQVPTKLWQGIGHYFAHQIRYMDTPAGENVAYIPEMKISGITIKHLEQTESV